MIFGRYEDELVPENGTWKILSRTNNPTIPTAEEYGPVLRARAVILDQNVRAANARSARNFCGYGNDGKSRVEGAQGQRR